VFLYIDETGQTGANFLDAQQPHFICAALVTKEHFDELYAQPWRAFLQRHGLAELHGNVAGPRAIEALAQDLVGLLTQADARFCVSRVEKRFALATNVFQALFDPAENKACHPMFIEEPLQRRRIAVQIGYALTKDVGEAFCESLFVQSKPQKVHEAFVGACDLLLNRLALVPDELARLSIRKVTQWARDNPMSFMLSIRDRKAGDGRHPNLIGFSNLLHCAQRIHAKWTPTVCRIVHDEQEQYRMAIAYWQDVWSRATPAVPQEPYQPTAEQVEQKPEAVDAYQKGALRNKLIGLACAQYKSDGKEMPWVKYKVVLRKTGVATITITCRRSGEKLAVYTWTEAGGLVEWTPRKAKTAKTKPEVVIEPEPQPTYQAVPTPQWQPTAEQLSNRYPVVALRPRWRPPQQPVIEDAPAASNVVEFRPRHITEPMA
jgi:hypothetical protein